MIWLGTRYPQLTTLNSYMLQASGKLREEVAVVVNGYGGDYTLCAQFDAETS